jgi:predicted dienelactone hydrolase
VYGDAVPELRFAIAFAACLAVTGAGAACDDTTYAAAGPYPVTTSVDAWTDPARGRMLPVRLYVPSETAAGKRPAIVFSHGLGGSRDGGETWGRHWASHGFIAIHLQHPGSDDALWKNRGGIPLKEAMLKGFTQQAYVDRLVDVRFAADEIARRAKAGDPVAVRVDLARLGISGHSFGARTTQAIAGETLPFPGVGDRYADSRFAAAIALSPAAAGHSSDWPARFAGMRKPFLSVTGTRDGDVFGGPMQPSERTEVFRNMPAGDKYLLVLEGAGHLVFDGGGKLPGDAQIGRCVRVATLAFWKAHLEDDAAARRFLNAGVMARTLGSAGTWDAK